MEKIKATHFAKFVADEYLQGISYDPDIGDTYESILLQHDSRCLEGMWKDCWFPAHFCSDDGTISKVEFENHCLRIWHQGKWQFVFPADFDVLFIGAGHEEERFRPTMFCHIAVERLKQTAAIGIPIADTVEQLHDTAHKEYLVLCENDFYACWVDANTAVNADDDENIFIAFSIGGKWKVGYSADFDFRSIY